MRDPWTAATNDPFFSAHHPLFKTTGVMKTTPPVAIGFHCTTRWEKSQLFFCAWRMIAKNGALW
jgi:hypothetical protein